MSVVYSLKHPEHVHRLILLSPAGVPHHPDASSASQEAEPPTKAAGSPAAQPATPDKVHSVQKKQARRQQQQTTVQRLFTYLWEEGYSPFQVVRGSLFLGPMLVGRYSSRRFSDLNQKDTEDMNDYILNITLAKGSSEYCISNILTPGA